MSDVICGVMHGDPRAWVPMEDHERLRRKKALMTACLMEIAHIMNGSAAEMEREHPNLREPWVKVAEAMNRFADALEQENAALETETRPAELGDA
ncbi:MAG: hypothetical protein MUF16_10555 [Burkholderiaceae bacterium]|jgi:hypothetical protein|nr:hypothetical protein [Burkholderiaceae bacterium]